MVGTKKCSFKILTSFGNVVLEPTGVHGRVIQGQYKMLDFLWKFLPCVNSNTY